MPRQLHKIISKEDPKKVIYLSAFGYEQALEEALDKLGWTLQSEWGEPYNSMEYDSLTSVWYQRSGYSKEGLTPQ